MERGIFVRAKRVLRELGRRRITGRHRYTDAGVLEVYLWAALHDRPVSWACDRAHWPPGTRRGPMPDASTVSRRMRTASVRTLLERLRERVLPRDRGCLVAIIDGKPLPVGPNSHDRQCGYGRGAAGMAKGYKAHVVIDTHARVIGWRVTPMNTDERTMARRMLRDLDHAGYLLGDGNYDANAVFRAGASRGVQVLAPRSRTRRGRPLGHRPHAASRVRSIEALESGGDFGRSLMRDRWSIERFFGQLSSVPGGLGTLPAWVRGWHRVRNWVAAKLALHATRQAIREGI